MAATTPLGEYQQLLYGVADGIATLTLNRPEKLNVCSVRLIDEMIDAFDRADADDAVRAVIVTGAGRAFCAGMDLEKGAKVFERSAQLDPTSDAARDYGGRLALRIFNCLKPVIAAVNGPAVGIGASMLLPMDVRLASETARFGYVFARRGIVPESCASWFLPRVVGISRAVEWCMTGRIFDVSEALAAGLVRSVHAPDALLPAAQAIAREVVAAAPVSVALSRQMLWRGLGMQHPMQAHRIESRGLLARGSSQDVAEGIGAFLEKRNAQFPDRVSNGMPDFFPWWEEPGYD